MTFVLITIQPALVVHYIRYAGYHLTFFGLNIRGHAHTHSLGITTLLWTTIHRRHSVGSSLRTLSLVDGVLCGCVSCVLQYNMLKYLLDLGSRTGVYMRSWRAIFPFPPLGLSLCVEIEPLQLRHNPIPTIQSFSAHSWVLVPMSSECVYCGLKMRIETSLIIITFTNVYPKEPFSGKWLTNKIVNKIVKFEYFN